MRSTTGSAGQRPDVYGRPARVGNDVPSMPTTRAAGSAAGRPGRLRVGATARHVPVAATACRSA